MPTPWCANACARVPVDAHQPRRERRGPESVPRSGEPHPGVRGVLARVQAARRGAACRPRRSRAASGPAGRAGGTTRGPSSLSSSMLKPAPMTTSARRSRCHSAKNRPGKSSSGISPSSVPWRIVHVERRADVERVVELGERPRQPGARHVQVAGPGPRAPERPPPERKVLEVTLGQPRVGCGAAGQLEHRERSVDADDRPSEMREGRRRRRSRRPGAAARRGRRRRTPPRRRRDAAGRRSLHSRAWASYTATVGRSIGPYHRGDGDCAALRGSGRQHHRRLRRDR